MHRMVMEAGIIYQRAAAQATRSLGVMCVTVTLPHHNYKHAPSERGAARGLFSCNFFFQNDTVVNFVVI
jgi:hypothetical protein